MDADWLEDTFNRSFDLCEALNDGIIMAVAKLQAELEIGMGFGGDRESLTDEFYKSMLDPFVGNYYETQKIVLQSAAKATGVTLKFGEPRAADGTPLKSIKSGMADGLIAVYCDQKGNMDLHNFWVAYGAFKDQNASKM